MKRLIVISIALALAACSAHKSPAPGAGNGGGSGAAGSVPVVSASPGSAIDSAAPANVGTAVTGAMVAAGHSDFYRFQFNGTVRDIVVVRLENKSTTLKPDIKVYNADRSLLFERNDGTAGASVEQALSVDSGKVFYVEVLPGWASAGAYQLSAVAQKAYDAYEPNNDVLHAAPVKFGASFEANVMDDKDFRWFHVSPAASGKVEVHLENLSTTLKPDVFIYSSSKSLVVEKNDGTAGADLDFTVDVDPGRDFYVEIAPGWGSAGKFRLTTRAAQQAADMAASLKAQGVVDLYGVYFDTDQTTIKPASATTLSEVGALMKNDPSLRLEVSGHTDNSGTKAHNMELSQGRAESVVAWIVGQYGVSATRLIAKGYGDTRPIAPNDNPDDMAKNRRVELRRI
jgi:outer membrane protein OmpA-like peptidoglycan-associated protein